jgi:Mor family transcriptional regulator
MEIKTEDILLEDFSKHKLLSMIAEVDIKAAREIARTFGGKKVYLPVLESFQRCARDRKITELRIMQEDPGDLAKEFGLTRNRVLKIINKGLDRCFPCGDA